MKQRSSGNVPPLEIREAMLVMAGFKKTDQLCPECEGRLFFAEAIDEEYSLWFNRAVEVETDHWTCPHCGYEKILTTSK